MYSQETLAYIATLLSENSTTILCFIVTFVYLGIYANSRPRNFPPGPRGFPIVGVAPYIGGRIEKSFAEWRKLYGDLMGFRVGTNLTVVLNNYDLMQEAFVKNAMVFSNRPDNFIFTDIMHKTGLAINDYTESYIKERKFASTSLSKLGFGKTMMENIILDESRHFVNQFSDGNQEFDEKAKRSLMNSIGNIICQVLLGRRYEFGDPEFLEISNAFLEFFDTGSLAFRMALILPWMRFVPPVRGSAAAIRKGFGTVDRIMEKKIAEHKGTLDESNPRDFIDEYLIEQKTNGDPSKNLFSNSMLLCMARDLYGAGMETVHTSLIYLTIILANRPEVQERMHREIDDAIGSDGLPKYSLRETMPYCQAVLKEVMRYRTVGPLGISHCTSKDVVFRGYNIPKGTTVIPNLYAIHHDPNIWHDPEEFIPERHLDSNGKVMYSKHFIPFGIGARFCIGKRLAEVELFVFMISMLQKFNIVPTPVAGCENPRVPENSDRTGLTLIAPDNARVTFALR